MLLGFPGLSGCAWLREVGAYQQGWRKAEVIEVGGANEIDSRVMTDCRTSASAVELSSSRFALLSYRSGTRRHLHVVSVQHTSTIARGDTVFANVLCCGTPIKVLSPKAVGSDETAVVAN